MRRRDFMLASAALAAGSAGVFIDAERMSASVDYPGRAEGHRLRDLSRREGHASRDPDRAADRAADRAPDPRGLPEPSESVETDVLVAGSGIAGLTALWQLTKRGARDVLLVSGPEHHGNAAAGRDGGLVFPTGAHYLPLPSMESRHVREMLAEFGIIRQNPYDIRPTFDERYVVHGPSERVLYRDAWQDGYLPTEDVGPLAREQYKRFFALVREYSNAVGSDGRRAFCVPLELSSNDARFLALDRLSFSAWLDSAGLSAPTLRWYLNYCCRDDYGRHATEISAWAGLHYFCSREGQAANAERGAVLTWPQGLAALADQLERAAKFDRPWAHASVASLRVTGDDDRVEALVMLPDGRAVRVKARCAIAAMPLFVLQHVLEEPERHGFTGSRDVPAYAPWLVSNFLLHAFPEERDGVGLAWDNVVYDEPGLGYVVSTHQEIRMSRPERTAFTAYHALSDMTPAAARHWLEQASVADLTQIASRDLRLAYGWRLPLCVDRVAITVRGHGMAVPAPGFLAAPGRLALRNSQGPIFFAHSDLSGMSLFEEAAWWGYQAAARAMATSARVSRSAHSL